jgi:membrane-bound lytic murein transglycosylase D
MMRRILPALLLALLLAATSVPARAAGASDPFPRPSELDADVGFWTRVYTEVGTDGGLIHDSHDLGIVYEVVSFPSGLSQRGRERLTDRKKDHYRAILRLLARGRRSGLDEDGRRVLALWGEGAGNGTFARAARQVRFQLGQADKFRAGLIRSGAWEPHIRKTLASMGLPDGLAALPHVESSYTPHAYSRVGAAGLWQFTRSTGRRFLRVDHVVDERLDPFQSTIAAARLLENNRKVTGTWPLAITAYNHGASGMRRAVRHVGTTDIARIVRRYRSRTFGFASRNFYVEFLAALDVDTNAERYFGRLVRDAPIAYEEIELEWFAPASSIHRALGLDLATLRASNPALRPSVWSGAKRVPRGYVLRVPRERLARPLSASLEVIPRAERFAAQTRDEFHVVRRGETLSQIASRYRVSMGELVALNGLRSRHRIRAGQRLRLPVDGSTRVASREAIVPQPPPEDGHYTVRRGDTVTTIASRFGLDIRQLVHLNGLRNPNRIHPGQTLVLQADAAAAPEPVVELAAAEAAPSLAALETEAEAAEDGPGVGAESDPGESSAAAEDEGGVLLADPSDYSVAADGTIEVQAAETLGHYAEWLGIRASRLRQLNHMRYRDPLRVGATLRLDLSRTDPEAFERQRRSYHRLLQETFFEQHEITGTTAYRLRRGDSLWVLAERRYRVPLWLLRQYNPDVDFQEPRAGSRITIPVVREREA